MDHAIPDMVPDPHPGPLLLGDIHAQLVALHTELPYSDDLNVNDNVPNSVRTWALSMLILLEKYRLISALVIPVTHATPLAPLGQQLYESHRQLNTLVRPFLDAVLHPPSKLVCIEKTKSQGTTTFTYQSALENVWETNHAHAIAATCAPVIRQLVASHINCFVRGIDAYMASGGLEHLEHAIDAQV